MGQSLHPFGLTLTQPGFGIIVRCPFLLLALPKRGGPYDLSFVRSLPTKTHSLPPLLSPCIMACHARTRRPWKEKTGADTGAAGGSLAMGALNKERKPLPTSALLALKGRTAPKILFRLRRVVLFRLRCIDWGVGKERDSWGLLFFGHRRPLHGAFARTATVGTLGMGRLHPRPPHSCRQGPPPTYAGGSGVSGCDSEAGFFDGDYLFACFVAIYPAGHLSLLPRCPCPLVLARKIERKKKASIPYKKNVQGKVGGRLCVG